MIDEMPVDKPSEKGVDKPAPKLAEKGVDKHAPSNIRKIFGLGPKAAAPCVDLSACSSPEPVPTHATTSTSASDSASPGGN